MPRKSTLHELERLIRREPVLYPGLYACEPKPTTSCTFSKAASGVKALTKLIELLQRADADASRIVAASLQRTSSSSL